MRKLNTSLRLSVLLAAMSLPALPATITYTDFFSANLDGTAGTGSLQQFDSSLGTLNSVFVFYGDANLEADAHADASGSFSATAADASQPMFAQVHYSFLGQINIGGEAPSFTVLTSGGDFVCGTGGNVAGCSYGSSWASNGQGGFFVSNGNVGNFIGGGTVAYSNTYSSSAGVPNLTNVSTWGTTFTSGTWSGTVGVTYDYTAAPEPTSVALMGLGLAGFGLLRKKAASR